MPDPISSFQNPRVKQAIRLRDAAIRRETGLLLIDGAREIRQAILGGIDIQALFVDGRDTTIFEALGLSPAPQHDAPASDTASQHDAPASDTAITKLACVTTRVTAPILEKIAFGNRNESVIAVAKQPTVDLERVPDDEHGLILVIDQVEKPGNLGAMVRTADAAGASAILMSDPVCEIWNANAIRASMGSMFRIPIGVDQSATIIDWLTQRSYKIVTARIDGTTHYRDVVWSKKNAIVVGSEATGLGTEWQRPNVISVSLPMRGTVDSLNVSVTAGILLYEAADAMQAFLNG